MGLIPRCMGIGLQSKLCAIVPLGHQCVRLITRGIVCFYSEISSSSQPSFPNKGVEDYSLTLYPTHAFFKKEKKDNQNHGVLPQQDYGAESTIMHDREIKC